MRKFFLLFALFLSAAAAEVQAQDQAVGLRLGGSAELLYQRDLSRANFLQFSVAFPNYDGVAVTGLYNWRCCEWTDWTPKTCDWYLNAGIGGALGAYDFDDTGFLLGVTGSVAFGCRFKRTPVSIEVDYRPIIGTVAGGGDKGFYKPGLWNFGLAVKFHF